ncbi:MAG TPA: SGNH/GDSL hydrolase family protein [Chloroflexota bacterium]|nr:SGNH/GDSL hydrolase family protein [Chloroflexota bacterium]
MSDSHTESVYSHLVSGQHGRSAAGTERSSARGQRRFSGWRLFLLRLSFVLLGLLLPLVLMEVTLRVFGAVFPGNYSTGKYLTADPVYGRFHVLNFKGWLRTDEFASYLRINSEGQRGAEIPMEKPPNTFRILALGDSYLEAAQVREDQSVAGRLAASLSEARGAPVDVINTGVGSWGTTQEWLLLQQLGERFQPDLQLVFFHPANDLWDNSYSLQRPRTPREPFFTLAEDGSLREVPFRLAQKPFRNELDVDDLTPTGVLRRTSWLYHVFETGVLDKLDQGNDTGPRLNAQAQVFWDPRAEDRVKPTWDVTLALFRAITEYGQAHGVQTVIVVVPSSAEVHDEDWLATRERIRAARLQPSNYERYQLSRVLDRRRQEVGAIWIDLGPALRAAAAGGERMYFRQDGHWTVAGNALVASVLQSSLEQLIH